MDWIFDNLWVLVAIAAVIARLFSKKGEGESGDQPAPPKEYEFEDPELAERTRKIREEIQRKIDERTRQQGQPAPASQSAPPPVQPSPAATTRPTTLPEILREAMQPAPPPLLEPTPSARRAVMVNAAEEAERQAALMEKLQEAKLMKEAAQRRFNFEQKVSDKEPAARQETRQAVLDDVRSPAALRRALIMREILGPPVALR